MAGECVRVAVVTLRGANPRPDRDFDAGNLVYLSECQVWINIVAQVTVDRPDLLVLDQTDCLLQGHQVSDEEDELFDLGRDLGADIVGYYIRGDTAGFRGCAAHPPGRQGFWVGDSATQWTFVHELTHVVGGNRHVGDSDNLMFQGGTGGITNPPPDLTADQCRRIRGDDAMGDCVLEIEGRLTFLRVHDVGTRFGPPGDQIDAEVVVQVDSAPGRSFGFRLRSDGQEGAHKAMLDLLRSAFGQNHPIRIDYRRTGLTNGVLLRVANLS